MQRCDVCDGTTFLEDKERGDTICADCGCCLPDRAVADNYGDRDRLRVDYVPPSTVQKKLRGYAEMFHLDGKTVSTAEEIVTRSGKVGAADDAFAIAAIFVAGGVGLSLREMALRAEVAEERVQHCVSIIKKQCPSASRSTTLAQDYVRNVVASLEGPKYLERFACELIARAVDHACTETCCAEQFEGRRTTTLAAGAVFTAASQAGLISDTITLESIAAASLLSTSAVKEMYVVFQGHWQAMFLHKPWHQVLNELK